jgi:hypothetical protein
MTPHPPRPALLRRAAVAVVVIVTLPLGAAGCAVVHRARSQASRSAVGEAGLTAADGYIPDGQSVSPFDDDLPAIAKLDPDLRSAIQHAAHDAEGDGTPMMINSGWRSKRLQQALLDQAVTTYGSEREARKWVSAPDKSNHVTGDAVDVGPTDADSWLSQHGSDYGLCQVYANEMWHYELTVVPGGICPAQITDSSAG